MLPFLLLPLFSLVHGHGQCSVEEDLENVVSSQLEGAWTPNMELSLQLSPSLVAEGLQIREIK